METTRPKRQVLSPSSWFDENYDYRIEEGDLTSAPSKIEGVRRDGGDFDDFHLQILTNRLLAKVFPPSIYATQFETDEFRRYVRIYVDYAKGHVKIKTKKKGEWEIHSWSVVPADEIRSRLASAT